MQVAFKVGDRVRIMPGIATPFVGQEGTVQDIQPNDRGIETMDRLVVMFERREKRYFYPQELLQIPRSK